MFTVNLEIECNTKRWIFIVNLFERFLHHHFLYQCMSVVVCDIIVKGIVKVAEVCHF